VILSVLVCDIWINVLLQRSALVGPLYIIRLWCLVNQNITVVKQRIIRTHPNI
jgi:hypothetical protein